jgi:hypothetical protein
MDVDGPIILKWSLKKHDMGVRIEFMYLNTGTSGGLL